ncbi:TIGR03620 family F420-dependent LLM class oxidoreductase [Actinomadura sp. NPDC047616]|uniref:TIGR03620 family F420-dependent LLM class oxidoreductase n=1 Tax=Actinomadura sp. NPDC047616 TaxID=3155914 RepID=UPI003408A2DA
MTNTAVVEARRRLGRVGAGLMVPIAPAEEWRRAVGRVEKAGFGSVWINEAIGGREAFAQLGVLLAASDRLVAGTGIANLWARHPAAMQGGAAVLADAYPGRVVLGVGVSLGAIVEGSGQKWDARPLRRVREYLDAMDASAEQAPKPAVPFPRLIAALGPKMLELAAERADGAITAALPVEHTRMAREVLGPDKLLVVGQAVVLETDPDKARAIARQVTNPGLPESPYDKALRRMGYGDEDLADGGTDELVDKRVPWGTPDAIAAKIAAHLDAGADHVSVFALTPDLEATTDQLEAIAPALVKLG